MLKPIRKRRNYINNKTLFQHMKNYADSNLPKEERIISNYLAEGILSICNNLAKKPSFNGYTWKDDMVADAIADCVAAVKNFNPENTENVFGYFTKIAYNAFLRRISKEKRETYIKHKNYQNSFIDEAFGEDITHAAPMRNEFSDEIIRDFEEKTAEAKKKSLTKKGKGGNIPSPVEQFIKGD